MIRLGLGLLIEIVETPRASAYVIRHWLPGHEPSKLVGMLLRHIHDFGRPKHRRDPAFDVGGQCGIPLRITILQPLSLPWRV